MSIDWDKIKRDYFYSQLNMGSCNGCSLKSLAVKYSISYGSLKNRSSKEGWNKELALSKKKIHIKVSKEIVEKKVITEREVREKNYEAADLCLDKGVKNILNLADGDVSAEIAIKLIQLGMKGRLDSTGISSKFEVSGKLTVGPEEESFVKDFQDHQKNKALLRKLKKYLGEQNEEGIIDL